jgi:hypothetical protein
MGKAKRRKAENKRLREAEDQWILGLGLEERQIVEVATVTHRKVVEGRGLVGGCYLLAFFVTEYLRRERDIATTPVVGWVNDGETSLMSSHAWVEYRGKKTDISLTRTEHPHAQAAGALLILDRVMRSGKATYTYHHERPSEAIALLQQLDQDVVAQKETEHLEMAARARSEELMTKYLENGPTGRTYFALRALIDAGR